MFQDYDKLSSQNEADLSSHFAIRMTKLQSEYCDASIYTGCLVVRTVALTDLFPISHHCHNYVWLYLAE